jgi:two-component system NarL family sensor kinase
MLQVQADRCGATPFVWRLKMLLSTKQGCRLLDDRSRLRHGAVDLIVYPLLDFLPWERWVRVGFACSISVTCDARSQGFVAQFRYGKDSQDGRHYRQKNDSKECFHFKPFQVFLQHAKSVPRVAAAMTSPESEIECQPDGHSKRMNQLLGTASERTSSRTSPPKTVVLQSWWFNRRQCGSEFRNCRTRHRPLPVIYTGTIGRLQFDDDRAFRTKTSLGCRASHKRRFFGCFFIDENGRTLSIRTKLILLAILPMAAALLLIALAVRHQQADLARREHQLVERAYMDARRTELRHYVDLAISTVKPLYDEAGDPDARQRQALKLLGSLDYGADGYFFVYDMSGKVLMHSRQTELVGQNLLNLRDPQGRAPIQDLIAAAKAGGGFVDYLWSKPSSGQMVPKLGYVAGLPQWQWMLGTGLYLDDIEHTMSQLDDEAGTNIATTLIWIAGIAAFSMALISAGGLTLNITEHRAADVKLRLMARQVVQSQEDERAHLARELHDGTSQTLVSAKLLIESAVDDLQSGSIPIVRGLENALDRVTDSLTEMRRISHRLRPAMLDTLGLPAALEQLAREFGDARQLKIDVLMSQPERDLPDSVKTALFRVAQEALTNIAKHAHAHRVQIRLEVSESTGVHLDLIDDGKGFDLEAVNRDPQRGIGLRNIRERLLSLGGQVVFQSQPGYGTQVQAHVSAAALKMLTL